jgi:hypothetical protein
MTEAEWLKQGASILRLEGALGWPSPRKQRLFAVACCYHIRHLLSDPWRRRRLAERAGSVKVGDSLRESHGSRSE